MSWFKKKTKRTLRGPFTGNREITEQEYVDREFKGLKEEVSELEKQIDLLKSISKEEYALLFLYGSLEIGDTYDSSLSYKGAQEKLKKEGYTYKKSIGKDNERKELWVKEEENVRFMTPTPEYLKELKRRGRSNGING